MLTKKTIGLCLFIDFTKAFDTIDHDLFISKLYNAGIRGPSFALIKSYLSNRQQRVHVCDLTSEYARTNNRVPQGSNLGPLLFNLYANKISSLPHFSMILQYAADTVFILDGDNIREIFHKANSSLQIFSDWSNFNKLSLSTSKTKCLLFNLSLLVYIPRLLINCIEIERVKKFKYLGLIIDDK